MMDSASYACAVAVSVAVRLPEAANDQNVVLLECSTLTPPLSSLILRFSRMSWRQRDSRDVLAVHSPGRLLEPCRSVVGRLDIR